MNVNYVHVAYCRIEAGRKDALLAALLANALASRTTEAGCLHFDVLLDPSQPDLVMLYEVFVDEAAFIAHQQTAHHKRYVAEGVPMLVSREREFHFRH